jgi:hypothetical protein
LSHALQIGYLLTFDILLSSELERRALPSRLGAFAGSQVDEPVVMVFVVILSVLRGQSE